ARGDYCELDAGRQVERRRPEWPGAGGSSRRFVSVDAPAEGPSVVHPFVGGGWNHGVSCLRRQASRLRGRVRAGLPTWSGVEGDGGGLWVRSLHSRSLDSCLRRNDARWIPATPVRG